MCLAAWHPARVLAALLVAIVLPLARPAGAFRLRTGAVNGLVRGEITQRMPVRKPVTDKREYLHTTFDSGLRVLAVHDPEAEKSSFAVAVEAGSLEDPRDFQGLAHFAEHMVFLGSEKYPDKDAFSNQLALYGGNHNAYTASEKTVYFNEIGNEGVEKGMDIFAQFFIAPSFDEEMVNKEIHAVDSEHKKNQPDTSRRLWHLLHSKANPENPMHQFATGDLQTLKVQPESKGKSLVQALKSFHQTNYCPRRLHLVIVANRSTDDLLAMGHRHFDALPHGTNCSSRPFYTDKPAFSRQLHNLGRRITVGSRGAPEMWLVMPLPPLQSRYKELSEAYIWHALAHYGPGSLKALLLEEDLSQSYSFYAENTVAGSLMLVTFSLTQKGAQHKDLVLEYFFAYMNAVRAQGVQSQLLSNLQQMRRVEFDYQEKQPSEFDLVSSLGGALPKYAPEDLLTGGVLIDEPDPKLIQQVLAAMVPSNMNIALVEPFFNETGGEFREPYYDFRYNEEAIDAALIQRLEEASGHGLLPPPDLQYVPRKLDLISEGAGEDGPEQLLKRGRVELWWLGLGPVKLPKAIVSMKIGFPRSVTSQVHDSVLAALHARIVQQVLEEPSDALQTCGLSYSVSTHNDGVALSFTGFDEHMLDLMLMVLPKVRAPGNTEAEFENARRQFLLDMSDVTKMQPYQHALDALEVVSIKDRISRWDMIHAAQDTQLVSPAAHLRFLKEVFAEARLSILFTGNIGRDRAQQISAAAEEAVGITRQQPEVVHDGHPQVINPQEHMEVRLANPITSDPNSATVVVYQFGVPDIADRVHMVMLGEFIDRPVFETLRTERQLGYVVFGWVAAHASIVEVRVLVQGFREQPDTVEALIEGTVQNLTHLVAGMSQEEFATRKNSLRTSLAKPPATMGQYAGKFWGQIWDQTYCFQKLKLELQYLDSAGFASPAPLLEAWKRTVSPSNSRNRISVKLFGSPSGQPIPTRPPGSELGTKVINLAESTNVSMRLQNETYWPQDYICK